LGDDSDPQIPEQSSSDGWWDRKITLLVAGFVLTGIIGPWLQFVQKRFEWEREVALKSFDRKIAAMQAGRQELTRVFVAGTTICEEFDRDHDHDSKRMKDPPLERNPALSADQLSRKERLQQTAALFVAADSFPDPARIKLPLEKLVVAWKTLGDVQERLRTGIEGAQEQKQVELFNEARRQFTENYDLVHSAMETEMEEFEDAKSNRSF
jgi:hypothetical protein